MKLEFTKMHGLGNDFILVDNLAGNALGNADPADISRKLCARRFGIGADGLILIGPSKERDFTFTIYNSDGSRAQMCGNGMRCFALYLFEKQITAETRIEVETEAGLVIPEIILDSRHKVEAVKVDMGKPVFKPDRIPFISDGDTVIDEKISLAKGHVRATVLSMGNPHAVVFVDDLGKIDVPLKGREIETHERFPAKTNVEFVEITAADRLKMKVWERGAGMTPACGTGACASLVAAALNKKSANRATVSLDGGDLEIEWNLANNHVYKRGPASFVFSGTVDI